MGRDVENAKITSTFLGIEDHGILTWGITLSGEGWGQGFGNRSWDHKEGELRIANSGFGTTIRELLETLDIHKWEDLRGQLVRVDHDFGCVYRIGHITKDQWTTGNMTRTSALTGDS